MFSVSIIIVPVESKDEASETEIVVSSSSMLLLNVVVTVSSSCFMCKSKYSW